MTAGFRCPFHGGWSSIFFFNPSLCAPCFCCTYSYRTEFVTPIHNAPLRWNLVRLETRRSSLSTKFSKFDSRLGKEHSSKSEYVQEARDYPSRYATPDVRQAGAARANEEASSEEAQKFFSRSYLVRLEFAQLLLDLLLRLVRAVRAVQVGFEAADDAARLGRQRQEKSEPGSPFFFFVDEQMKTFDGPVLVDRLLVRLGGSTTTDRVGRALLFEFLVVVGLAGVATATADAIVLRFEVVQHSLGVLWERQHRQSHIHHQPYLT